MSKKLSKTQHGILKHMLRHRLHSSRGGSSWLNGVPGKNGLDKRVHGNTVHALLTQGYIKRADTDATPWYRRDYTITDAGRAALARA